MSETIEPTTAAADDPTRALLSTTDGSRWAAEFMRLFGDRKNEIDDGLMTAWFANALEAGWTAGHRAATHPTAIDG